MHPKHRLLFIVALCIAGSVGAQADSLSRGWRVTLLPNLLAAPHLKFGMQPGVFYTGKHWGGGAEIGGPIHKATPGFANMRYTRFGGEVRYALKQKKTSQAYIAVAATYANRGFTAVDSGRFFVQDGSDGYNYAKATIRSPIATLSQKYGWEITAGNGLVVDFFVGLGLRRIYTKYSNIEGFEPVSSRWFGHIGPIASYRYNRAITGWHLPWGMRVGYLFK